MYIGCPLEKQANVQHHAVWCLKTSVLTQSEKTVKWENILQIPSNIYFIKTKMEIRICIVGMFWKRKVPFRTPYFKVTLGLYQNISEK